MESKKLFEELFEEEDIEEYAGATKKEWLYTKTGGEIYPAPVFLYLNRHSFHTVLQFK